MLATFARSRTLPPPTRLGNAVGLVALLDIAQVFEALPLDEFLALLPS